MEVLPAYKPAKLYDCKGDVGAGKEWYFFFYFLDPSTGKYKRFLERFNINRIKRGNDAATRRARYDYAKLIIKQIDEWLEAGGKPGTFAIDERISVRRGLIYAMDLKAQKNLRQRSLQSFSNCVDRFLEFAEAKKIADKPLEELTKQDIIQYGDWLANSRKISNLTNNKYITHLRAVLGELVERDVIAKNPCSNLGKLKVEMGNKNIPLTYDEVHKLRELLPKRHRRLWMFSMFIYYGLMRSQEICLLRREYLDLNNGLIHLPGSVGKTGVTRIIKLVPEFVDFLKAEGVEDLPGKMFLFSRRGSLEPGAVALVRNRVSELWKEVVKDELGIDKDMYALKHTSAKLFILNGGSKEALQAQMGHSTIRTTEIYIKRITPQESLERYATEFVNGIL